VCEWVLPGRRFESLTAGPLRGHFFCFLFAIYMRDGRALTVRPHTLIALYAEDTTVSSSKSPASLCKHLQQRYLDALVVRCRDWKVTINAMKSKVILILEKRVLFLVPLTFNGMKIPSSTKNFPGGLTLDYVVEKVVAASKALYPLLCGKSEFSLRNNGNCICRISSQR
jgi:hypothetical protein